MAGQDDESAEIAGAEVSETDSSLPALKAKTGRRSFARLKREMTDIELSNPAVQKMMMDELDRMDEEREALLLYRDKHAEVDKENAVLKEKMKPKVAADVFFGGCTCVGSIFIGLAPSAWAIGVIGQICAGAGALLVAVGIAAKVTLK
jgi:hypothetical protein